MNHGSLFSGIGGFDLASEWMGWDNVFQVEWDDYATKVLEKNFPNVKRYGDIRQFGANEANQAIAHAYNIRYDGNGGECHTKEGERKTSETSTFGKRTGNFNRKIDIISGGFPCQPFSSAGKRKGTDDNRYLWPEMLRVIREVRPSYVVGENVAGLLSMENGRTLDRIFADLENEGYAVESFIIPAASVGAWHRRDRIWIVGYSNEPITKHTHRRTDSEKTEEIWRQEKSNVSYSPSENATNTKKSHSNERNNNTGGDRQGRPDVSKLRISNSTRCRSTGWWQSEPNVGRVANGIPRRVDRLKGLGNAIVPQVAYEIFKAIEHHEASQKI